MSTANNSRYTVLVEVYISNYVQVYILAEIKFILNEFQLVSYRRSTITEKISRVRSPSRSNLLFGRSPSRKLRTSHAGIVAARNSIDAECRAQERRKLRGRAMAAREELETRKRALLMPRPRTESETTRSVADRQTTSISLLLQDVCHNSKSKQICRRVEVLRTAYGGVRRVFRAPSGVNATSASARRNAEALSYNQNSVNVFCRLSPAPQTSTNR